MTKITASASLFYFGNIFKALIKIGKTILAIIFYFVKDIFKILINFIVSRIKELTKRDYLKIGAIVIILFYAIKNGITVIDFLVLTYGLISILFIVESRIAAGIALLFLICVPFLLIYKKDAVAETAAIYAYYFLVITVIIQIREYQKEEKESREYYRK